MAIDIVRGTTNKPAATQALEQRVSELGNYSGELFIGYPIIVSPAGSYPIDALLVSKDTGIVVFDLVEGTDPGDYQDRQDELYNQLEARLKKHSDLVDRRKLRIPIHPISFAPAITSADSAQDCHSSAYNLARLRNRLFTAITRSKAWIRVLGIGTNMRALIDEYEILKSSDFELRFRYPTEDEREQLRIVHKDMSEKALAHLRKKDRILSDLLSDIEAGDVSVQDLNKDLVEKLRQHFENID